MDNLINGIPPEEIKRWMKCASFDCSDISCDECQYSDACASTIGSVCAEDALALIERLEAQQPKWISVKDRLPPREVNVLTVNGHGCIRVMAFWQNYKNCWLWNDNAVFKHYNDITHWMPLPEPPEVKT